MTLPASERAGHSRPECLTGGRSLFGVSGNAPALPECAPLVSHLAGAALLLLGGCDEALDTAQSQICRAAAVGLAEGEPVQHRSAERSSGDARAARAASG